MKKLNLLLIAILSICAVSCGDGSKDPLSKKEALKIIIEDKEDKVIESIYIPNKITRVSQLDYSEDTYKTFEEAGLLTVADTTITISSWYSNKTYPAKDIKLTETGAKSITSEFENKYQLFFYKYEINKIVDMKLFRTERDEEMNADIYYYFVYYTGTIIEASPFANAEGINIKDKYPLRIKKWAPVGVNLTDIYSLETEEAPERVMVTAITAIYRDGKLIYTDVESNKETSDIDANFDKAWIKAVQKGQKTLF